MEVIVERHESHQFINEEEKVSSSSTTAADDKVLSPDEEKESKFSPLIKEENKQNQENDNFKSEVTTVYFSGHAENLLEENSNLPAPTTKGLKLKLSQVPQYRQFMSGALNIKIYLLASLRAVNVAREQLNRRTIVLPKEEPVISTVGVGEAWAWVVEEAFTLVAMGLKMSASDSDMKEWRGWGERALNSLYKSFGRLESQVKNMEKAMKKLEAKFKALGAKSEVKFRSNLLGAKVQWEESDRALMEADVSHVTSRKLSQNIENESSKWGSGQLSLQWDLNGLMFKGSDLDSFGHWTKLSVISSSRDQRFLLKYIANGAAQYLEVVEDALKEALRHMDTISSLMDVQQQLLSSTSGVYPREEVQMHCSVIRNGEIFSKGLGSVTKDVTKRVDNDTTRFATIQKRSGLILGGNGKRIPLDKWAQLQLESRADGYLNEIVRRYCNGKEKESKDLSNGPTPKTFKDSNNVNSQLKSTTHTCFLFFDERPLYSLYTRQLLQGKPLKSLDDAAFNLCSDAVKCFSIANIRVSQAKLFVVDVASLLNSGEFRHWLQLTHRSLAVGGIAKKCTLVVNALVNKVHDVESTLLQLLKALLDTHNKLSLLEDSLKLNENEILRFVDLFQSQQQSEQSQDQLSFLEEKGQKQAKSQLFIEFLDFDMIFNLNGLKIKLKALPISIQEELISIAMFTQIQKLNLLLIKISSSSKLLSELGIELENFTQSLTSLSFSEQNFRTLEKLVVAKIVINVGENLKSISQLLLEIEGSVGEYSGGINLLNIYIQGKKSKDKNEELKLLEDNFEKLPETFEISEPQLEKRYEAFIQKGIRKNAMIGNN